MLVEITSGVYGKNVNGRIRVIRAGETTEVDLDEAKRLVDLGAARFCEPVEFEEKVVDEDVEIPEEEEEVPFSEPLSEAEMMKMTLKQLKQLAAEEGVEPSKLRTKADVIEAIMAERPNLDPEAPIV